MVFYVLSKVLAPLTHPLSLAVLLLLLSAALRVRKPAASWVAFWVALVGLYAASTDPVADYLATPLERPYMARTVPARVDAIVVFGGCVDRRASEDDIRLDDSGDRLIKAIILTREHPEAVLIVSGARGLFGRTASEGELLKRLAVRLGVPERRIVVEPNAMNTRDNAVECCKILKRDNLKTFLLVTSAMHMPRSLATFTGTGCTPIPYAADVRSHVGMWTGYSLVPNLGALDVSTGAIHEYVGLLVYRLRGMA